MRVIVVIDDDEPVRTALGRLLALEGLQLAFFESAEAYLAAPPPETACVLIDVNLPGMSGLDLQKRLRARPPSPPIIMMTGRPDPALRQRAEKLGCEAFLCKPFDGESLLAAIDAALPDRLRP